MEYWEQVNKDIFSGFQRVLLSKSIKLKSMRNYKTKNKKKGFAIFLKTLSNSQSINSNQFSTLKSKFLLILLFYFNDLIKMHHPPKFPQNLPSKKLGNLW